MKGQPSKWEKITANKATDKELISKIYKQLNIRKPNNTIKKVDIRPKQTFPQRCVLLIPSGHFKIPSFKKSVLDAFTISTESSDVPVSL